MARRKSDYPIAGKIQQLRKARGWTQADIASKIGRAQSRVAKWELSEGMPNPADLLALANAFGVPLIFLCDDQMLDPRDAEPPKPDAGLSQDETLLLGLIRKIGPDTAIQRLMGLGANDHDSTKAPKAK